MSTTMQVDHLAEKIKTPTKATFLTSIFKKGLKNDHKNSKGNELMDNARNFGIYASCLNG